MRLLTVRHFSHFKKCECLILPFEQHWLIFSKTISQKNDLLEMHWKQVSYLEIPLLKPLIIKAYYMQQCLLIMG